MSFSKADLAKPRADLAAAGSPTPEGVGVAALRGAALFRLPGDLLLLDVLACSQEGTEILGCELATGHLPREILTDHGPLGAPSCAMLIGSAGAGRHLVITRRAPPEGSSVLAEGGIALPVAQAGNASDFLRLWSAAATTDRALLLRFLAETCAGVLRVGQHPAFVDLLLRLADGVAASRQVQPLTRQGPSAISIWQVPGPIAPGFWHLLSARGVSRIPPPLGGVLIMPGAPPFARPRFLLPPLGPGGVVLAPLRFESAGALLPGALEPLSKTSPEARAVGHALSRRLAARPDDPLVARLLRDRRLLARPAQPRRLDDPDQPLGGALELAISDAGGGVFLRGWLRDPLGMATGGLALRDLLTGARVPIPSTLLHRIPRADLAAHFAKAPHGGAGATPGFVAHLPQAERFAGGAVAQWGLDLRLASGEAIQLTAPPGLLPPERARALVLRAVQPDGLSTQVLDACLAPAVARLQRAALAALAAPDLVQIGRTARGARTAIIIPLYRNLHFLRFQIAAFARDTALRIGAQFIFVLDSPEQREQVEHQLRGLHGIYGLPVTLVVMSANAGYSTATNAGAGVAVAGVSELLLLNSDVVPDVPGWLAAMQRPLRRDAGVLAVGPKLLFEDGSVQHAGLLFQRHGAAGDWLNGHYGKGMPRHHPEVQRARSVPGVTGAALLVRRAAFETLGGLCADYVVGDYEDSDLCLRLRALGGDIRYAPAAELFHFERQSITGHGGYAQTLAGAHNRRLHHLRWDADIAALMARFPSAREPRAHAA